MASGEIANVHCPGELDTGGTKNLYTDLDSEWKHEYTDMNYLIEIKWCDLKYQRPKPNAVNGPLEPGRCFYV